MITPKKRENPESAETVSEDASKTPIDDTKSPIDVTNTPIDDISYYDGSLFNFCSGSEEKSRQPYNPPANNNGNNGNNGGNNGVNNGGNNGGSNSGNGGNNKIKEIDKLRDIPGVSFEVREGESVAGREEESRSGGVQGEAVCEYKGVRG
eukprot:TRINITY_DN14787_c0_g2_i2.p2 TRINITY_DN14787_c0_g2~~TRINITY_DN14787_c0_g2_i2.p2  ORF type:complete len:150 (-),score=39.56 TRINITY_DN14787_c0_g2_i2:33-482(-)